VLVGYGIFLRSAGQRINFWLGCIFYLGAGLTTASGGMNEQGTDSATMKGEVQQSKVRSGANLS
jgi:hypothetical protein